MVQPVVLAELATQVSIPEDGIISRTIYQYVRTRLRLARGAAARRAPAWGAQFGALSVVAGLAWSGLAPWLSVAAFALLAARAVLGLMPRSLGTPTPLVGVQEVGFSLLTVASIALG